MLRPPFVLHPTHNAHTFLLFLLPLLSPSAQNLFIIATTSTHFRASFPRSPGSDIATLETLARAQSTTVVFAPSLLHLRAYLSTVPVGGGGVLAVWGLVAAHKETQEFSAQGVGRTVAGLVEHGGQGWRVVVGEGEDGDVMLPVLSETGRVGGGLVGEGRMVGAGNVLGRWFKVLEEEEEEEDEVEGEMAVG